MVPRSVFMSEDSQSNSSDQPSGGALRWVILAVGLIVGLWFGIQALRNAKPSVAEPGAAGGPQGPPPATVIAQPVIQKPVQERRQIVGTLQAKKRAEVASQETGAVKEVKVDVGDAVKKGAVLVLLDDRRLVASLAEANAKVTAANAVVEEQVAELERAERDLTMKEKLFRQRAVSEREFLDAQREVSVSKARFGAAEEEKGAAESVRDLLIVRMADLEVKAPFDGQIVRRHVDPGEWLSPGSSVVTLISTGTIEAWMNVPERFVTGISEQSDQLEIVVDGNGMRVPAKSVRQVSDIDPVTRLFPVVVDVDDQGGKLLPGLSVHADMLVGERQELLGVPVDALIETFQGASVFRAASSPGQDLPIAERVPVEVEFREDGFVYLKQGALRPGDQVVVEGNERLFPGTPLILGELPDVSGAGKAREVKP